MGLQQWREALDPKNHPFDQNIFPLRNRILNSNFAKKTPPHNQSDSHTDNLWHPFLLSHLSDHTKETGYPRNLPVQWTWVSFLGPVSVPVYLMNCYTNAGATGTTIVMLNRCQNFQNGTDLLKGHLVFLLLCWYLFPRPREFSKLTNASVKRPLPASTKTLASAIDCCLALGERSCPCGFQFLSL